MSNFYELCNCSISFSSDVTHIVTEFDTVVAVLRKLDLTNIENLGDAQVVKVTWFTDCMKAGHVVEVLEEHRVPSHHTTKVMSFIHKYFSSLFRQEM